MLNGLGSTPIVLRFPGANLQVAPSGEGALERKTAYYLGPQEDWHESVHFDRVRFREIFPGIDLIFITSAGELEYNFEVHAHADASLIRMHFEGARISLLHSGDLELKTETATIGQRQPRATQGKRNINCRYLPLSSQDFQLHLDNYDRNATLFIDPALAFSTYIGGAGFDAIYATTTDPAGNVYVAGETSSASLWNNSQGSRPTRNAFVAKLNSNATQVLFTVYLGGSGNDGAKGIAVDVSGNIYITGVTSSANFPVTAGALSTTAPGPQTAFVAKLNSLGALQYSTYLGGSTADVGFGIAVDSTGAVYVAGETESVGFPVTPGAFQTTFGGGMTDCFVSKLNPVGSALVYSTFLGGLQQDVCNGIAIDPTGDAYLAGTTYSTNFPVVNPIQQAGGTASAFVTKINAAGTALIYSTFLGGTNVDLGNAIAVDASGSAYIAGSSASIDFPVTPGVLQSVQNGVYNAFVSKLSPSGSSLVYSTLLGGSNSDTAASIAVDALGRAFVSGYTSSSNFPTVGPVQSAFGGAFDAFASVLDPAAATLVFSSYFGGSSDDKGYAIAILPGGNFYLAGTTASGNFPTAAAIQPGLNVAYDCFLLEVGGLAPALGVTVIDSGSFTQQQQGATYMLTVSNAPGAISTSGPVTLSDSLPTGLMLTGMSGAGWSCSGASCWRSDALASGASYPAITVTVNVSSNATSPQVNSVTATGGGSTAASTTNSIPVVSNGGLGQISDLAVRGDSGAR